MGLYATYTALQPEVIGHAQNDYELWEKLYSDAPALFPDLRHHDLHRWHGVLVYLLDPNRREHPYTGRNRPMNMFSTAILGKHVFGEHHFVAKAESEGWNADTERRPYYLSAAEVRAASKALEEVKREALLNHYDRDRMKKEVYWGGYLDRADITEVFEEFRGFYHSAAAHDEAMLVKIG